MNEIKVFLEEELKTVLTGKKKGTYSVERQVTENWLIP